MDAGDRTVPIDRPVDCPVLSGRMTRPECPAPSWRLEEYDSLPSTSDLCRERAVAGEAAGLAVRADRQTAGRGSRGRNWTTPGGNLALSVLLRPQGPVAEAGQWALLAAVALHQALLPFSDGAELTIKWPNDILFRREKVAGLLVDAAGTPDGHIDWVVLGMGANLRSAPPPDPASTNPPPAALGPHDPAAVAATVLDRLSSVLRIWRDDGFAAIRELWLAHAHPLGTLLRVRSPRHDAHGAFAGLTPGGALLLATGDGVRAFPTGEVLFA